MDERFSSVIFEEDPAHWADIMEESSTSLFKNAAWTDILKSVPDPYEFLWRLENHVCDHIHVIREGSPDSESASTDPYICPTCKLS